MKRFAVPALILTLSATPAMARDAALERYDAGQYEQAIESASSEDSAPGFALAARAALADAMMRPSPCLSCLRRAETFARLAIAADDELPEGHLYLAVSLGYQSRIVGPVRAQLDEYPAQAKANLDAALRSDPNNAWVLAALGGWNIEVVRGGGAMLAHWLYLASVPAGLKAFDAAFRTAPDNIVLRYQYALSLAGLDYDAYSAQVTEALTRASKGSPATAYDGFVRSRARELLAALNRNARSSFLKLVRRDQGYP